MRIRCNGEVREIQTGMTLEGLLRQLGLAPDTVFAECDGVVVPKEQYAQFVLSEGARLELIRFVGGG